MLFFVIVSNDDEIKTPYQIDTIEGLAILGLNRYAAHFADNRKLMAATKIREAKRLLEVDLKGATKAIQENLPNVGFLRTRIDFIANCFAKNEVDEIWITFPDPQMNKNRRRKKYNIY